MIIDRHESRAKAILEKHYEIPQTDDQKEFKEKFHQEREIKSNQSPANSNEGRRETLKKLAKQLKEEHGIKSTHAHECIARSWGYKSYNHFLSML